MKINAKSIEGLKMLSQGLNLLIEGLIEESTSTAEDSEVISTVATETTTTSLQDSDVPVESIPNDDPDDDSEEDVSPPKNLLAKATPTPDEDESPTEDSTVTEEKLNEMTYNNLKKYAKELGLSAVGTRAALVKRILSLTESAESEEETYAESDDLSEVEDTDDISADEEEPVETSTDIAEYDDSEDDDIDEEDDEEEDPIVSQVKEAAKDMDDDTIRDLLESLGISPKGKRQALIDKLIRAVQDGEIEFSDDDEEEDNSDDVEESGDTVSDDEPEVVSGDITDGMTKKRKEAFDSLCKDTTEAFENEDILREDLIEFINEFNGTRDKMKKVSDEDLLAQYFELSALLVDDDGNIVEEGAYYVNDEPYCCGHPLIYDKKKQVYRCAVCESEYETE